nr:E-beta-farnesene synthase [Tanacetum cinerariifolium]
MADINAPSGQAPAMAPLIRTNDQIFPRIKWLSIRKCNCYLYLQKSESNPINKIAVDLLKHTNFFRAFTASSTIPSIYIQQFWDIVQYDKKVRCCRCQLDEQWFVQTKDTLREALQITPVNNNQAFIAPPSFDGLINFVNLMGYPKLVRNLSNVGVVIRAHIDYAERIWEEFTQSIHTFIEEKRNMSRHTTGKKKATLIVNPSIRFTKLIIHHLQRRQKFHPRPDSSLHLPNEEPVLGYLKFSAKGTKREVFRMPIPDSLIIADIQKASYYREYLAKVAQHRRYLAGEIVSDMDSPILKPTKLAMKHKSTAPKAPPRPSVSTPVTSAQPTPTSAPAKPQEKKRFGGKHESMNDAPRGPLPPVVIREPESGKYQPLPEVPRKGKAKSGSEEESEMVVHGADEGDAGAQDEGQAGSKPDESSKVPARPDPGNAGANELFMPSPVVHTRSDHEHMDLDVADVSSQTSMVQLDERFTAMAYPKRIGELEHIMANLIQEKKGLEERLDSHGKKKSRELPKMPPGSAPHLLPPPHLSAGSSRASRAPRASGSSQVPPPPTLPFSTNQESQSKGSVAPSSSKIAASAEYQAWTTTNIRLRPSISLIPVDLEIYEDLGTDEQAQSSDDEEIRSAHIPKVNLRQDWWKPFEEERPTTLKPTWSIRSSDVPVLTNNWASALASNYSPPPEDSLLTQTGDIATFIDWFCKRRGITELKPQDLEGPAFEIVKVFHPDVIILQYQMEECHKLLTDSVDNPILRHNVSKPLPLGGPPGQVIIQSDFFLNKYLEYLRYGSKGRRPTLSILKMKAVYYPDAGLEQMGRLNHLPPKDKKILTTAVNQWTRHLVIRQRIEDFQLRIKSYQTQLNLTKPQWDATGFEYKHDYTVIYSLRAVMCRDKYGVQMMMHFNEIHKFSNDQEGCGSNQGVHVRHSKAIKDKDDLMQPGELCCWTRQRGRLQTFETYRMIKSF